MVIVSILSFIFAYFESSHFKLVSTRTNYHPYTRNKTNTNQHSYMVIIKQPPRTQANELHASSSKLKVFMSELMQRINSIVCYIIVAQGLNGYNPFVLIVEFVSFH